MPEARSRCQFGQQRDGRFSDSRQRAPRLCVRRTSPVPSLGELEPVPSPSATSLESLRDQCRSRTEQRDRSTSRLWGLPLLARRARRAPTDRGSKLPGSVPDLAGGVHRDPLRFRHLRRPLVAPPLFRALEAPQSSPQRSRLRRNHGNPLPHARGFAVRRHTGSGGSSAGCKRRGCRRIRDGASILEPVPAQQSSAARKYRPAYPLAHGDAEHASDPSFRTPGGDELELLDHLFLVGPAAR